MARSGLTLVIVIIAIILAISFQQAFALKCWHCDSALNPSCGYPFEEKKLNKTLLVDCTPIGGDPVCLKIVNADKFIARKCVNNKNNVRGLCWLGSAGNAPICEQCTKDECNGAAQYGPAAIVFAVPIAILKVLSLF